MSLNVSFYCRKSKANRQGLAPVEAAVSVNGERIIASLPARYEPEAFAKAMASKRDGDIRRYVENVRRNLTRAVEDMADIGQAVTARSLVDIIRTGGVRLITAKSVFDAFIGLQRAKVGVSMTQQNLDKYVRLADAFLSYYGPDRQVGGITKEVIDAFAGNLRSKYKEATVVSMLTKLKSIMAYAFNSGKVKANPFAGVRLSKPKPMEEFLTDAELDAVRNLTLTLPCLQNARDLFMFQCASGLSYSDMAALKPEDIRFDGDTAYIVKNRKKTGTKFTTVILPEGLAILKANGMSLRVISNQKYNMFLLHIEQMAGLTKRLHSHLGRKVYGSTLLRKGCSVKTVSKALGHSNINITQSVYAFLQDKDIINEIKGKLIP